MKYFELTADKEITNPIRIQKLQGSVYKKGISGLYSAGGFLTTNGG